MMMFNKVEVWAVDEVKFEQHGTRCRMWYPREMHDPVLLHHPTRKSVGYFGAVRISDGKILYSRVSGSFNGKTFFEFLKYMRRHTSKKVKIVVIADNAGYHHARLHQKWRDDKCDSFSIEFLPPYSPELNPIEKFWRMTREKATHNRYFDSIGKLCRAVESFFDLWRNGGEDVRRPCGIFQFAMHGPPKTLYLCGANEFYDHAFCLKNQFFLHFC